MRYALVWKEEGVERRGFRPFRGGKDGALRAAQHLITRPKDGGPPVLWVEVVCGGEVVYRTEAEEWR